MAAVALGLEQPSIPDLLPAPPLPPPIEQPSLFRCAFLVSWGWEILISRPDFRVADILGLGLELSPWEPVWGHPLGIILCWRVGCALGWLCFGLVCNFLCPLFINTIFKQWNDRSGFEGLYRLNSYTDWRSADFPSGIHRCLRDEWMNEWTKDKAIV